MVPPQNEEVLRILDLEGQLPETQIRSVQGMSQNRTNWRKIFKAYVKRFTNTF
jgi:hypothetical protein